MKHEPVFAAPKTGSPHDAIGAFDLAREEAQYAALAELAKNAGRDTPEGSAVVKTKERVPGPTPPEEHPQYVPPDLDAADVELAHDADVAELSQIFHVPTGTAAPEAFFDAVVRDACSTTKNLEVSWTALWEARVVYRRLAADEFARKTVVADVEEARRVRHEATFERLFILACADLFAKVLSTPIAENVPPALDARWARVRAEMKSEGLLLGPDEIEWREAILKKRIFDLRAEVFGEFLEREDKGE